MFFKSLESEKTFGYILSSEGSLITPKNEIMIESLPIFGFQQFNFVNCGFQKSGFMDFKILSR